MTPIELMRRRANARLAELHAATTARRTERTALADVIARQQTIRDATAIAQTVAQRVQKSAHRKIADIVTQSMQIVFDEPYTFKIRFEQKRGRTDAVLLFERDGVEIDPMTASGGGVVDVAAFALRLSCLMLSRPPLRRFLVLDEPFKFLSAPHRPRVRELLETLSKELQCQMVIITHLPEIITGTVIRL